MINSKLKKEVLKSVWILLLFGLKLTCSKGCIEKNSCDKDVCCDLVQCTNETIDAIINHLKVRFPENSWCVFANCHYLEISDSQIFDYTKNTLINFHLCGLRNLKLSNNHITSISANAFYKFVNLIKLDLSCNDIASIKIQSGGFSNLHELRTLNLSYNQLETVYFDIFKDVSLLEQLHLRKANIKNIQPGTFNSLKNLVVLDLSYNKGESIDNNTFQGLWSLRELNLTESNIKNISAGAFNSLKKLNTLDLSNNELEFLQKETFDDLPSLQKLYLMNNKIQPTTNLAFCGMHLPNLSELRLDNNSIKDIQPGAFYELSFQSTVYINNYDYGNFTPYNVLRLNYNKLTHILHETFSKISHVGFLKLDNNNIETLQPGAFNGLFMLEKLTVIKPNEIQTIVPSFNNLHLHKNLLTSLSKNTFIGIENLAILRLDDNKIHNIEMGAFAGLTTLTTLKLNNNDLENITEKSFENLQRLEILDLSYNKISMLKLNLFQGLSKLRNLILCNNQIKELPIGVFSNFPFLENLQLGNNVLSNLKTGTFSNLGRLKYLNFSSNMFLVLNEIVLHPLKNLEVLDLDNNSFSYMNYTSLLSHHPKLHFISINHNNWTCNMLSSTLKLFSAKGVDYLFNATLNYTHENIDGIFCSETDASAFNTNASLNKSNELNINFQNLLIPMINNISTIFNRIELHMGDFNKEVSESSKNRLQMYNKFQQFYDAKESTATISDVTHFFILFFIIFIFILFVYKSCKDFQNGNVVKTRRRSEMRSLNSSSFC